MCIVEINCSLLYCEDQFEGVIWNSPEDFFMMKDAGMKHVDSLNIIVPIGTVGVVSPPAPPALFDCLQFDL